MQISSRELDKTVIFDVSGDIDLANSPTVRKASCARCVKNVRRGS